jgi:drug/metabolite transporter superfamily protein YnfA
VLLLLNPSNKMVQKTQDFIQKAPLIISVCIVIPVSLLYGFNPELLFDIQLQTIDEQNFFKSIMGMYIGFSILWLLGIYRNQYLKMALVTNVIFMIGLGFGRVLSLFLDGTPTFGYVFGTFAEIFLGCYGIWVLTNKNTNFAKK